MYTNHTLKLFSVSLLVGWFFVMPHALQAQQEPMFTKYMFNTLTYNPAYAGSKENLSINALYRNQWYGWNSPSSTVTGTNTTLTNGYGGAPVTQTLGIHSPTGERVGIGLNLVNDEIGAVTTTSADFSYAYRIDFGKGKVALGLNAGLVYWRSDISKLSIRHLDDALINVFQDSEIVPNFGAGLYYYSDNFYAGISVPRLLQWDLRDGSIPPNSGAIATYYRHYYFTGGVAIPIGSPKSLVFKPSFVIKSVGILDRLVGLNSAITPTGSPTEADVDFSFLLSEVLWIGASIRADLDRVFDNDPFPGSATRPSISPFESGDVWMSFLLKNGARIGFAYDYGLNPIADYNIGSFELMLGYDFRYVNKSNVATPRYF